jgi:hypothetical protein
MASSLACMACVWRGGRGAEGLGMHTWTRTGGCSTTLWGAHRACERMPKHARTWVHRHALSTRTGTYMRAQVRTHTHAHTHTRTHTHTHTCATVSALRHPSSALASLSPPTAPSSSHCSAAPEALFGHGAHHTRPHARACKCLSYVVTCGTGPSWCGRVPSTAAIVGNGRSAARGARTGGLGGRVGLCAAHDGVCMYMCMHVYHPRLACGPAWRPSGPHPGSP